MPEKPLVEVLTRLIVAERYRLDPDNQMPWENMSDHAQAVELAAVAEAVRMFDGFNLEIAQEGDNIVLRPIIKKKPQNQQRQPKNVPSPTELGGSQNAPMLDREASRMMGFEGDPCPECQALMLVRNGSCLKCQGCGATTGCS